MNTSSKAIFNKVALVLAGAILGAFGISTYHAAAAGSPLSSAFWQSVVHAGNNTTLAAACTPTTDESDIFFLTCGGIY